MPWPHYVGLITAAHGTGMLLRTLAKGELVITGVRQLFVKGVPPGNSRSAVEHRVDACGCPSHTAAFGIAAIHAPQPHCRQGDVAAGQSIACRRSRSCASVSTRRAVCRASAPRAGSSGNDVGESKAHQVRFDDCREKWRRTGDPQVRRRIALFRRRTSTLPWPASNRRHSAHMHMHICLLPRRVRQLPTAHGSGALCG
jgi:hypothetical protein